MGKPFAEHFPYESAWGRALGSTLSSERVVRLAASVEKERESATVYPLAEDVFRAFWLTPLERVRVVILGQDPYHRPGQAHGLSFSVLPPTKFPPSLRNIFRELETDLGCSAPETGDLTSWAEQGVFLLNTILTVREGEPLSHEDFGWTWFTDAVIEVLAKSSQRIVFVLWGRSAWRKELMLAGTKHVVIKAPHPSPLSAHRGFFGSRPFSTINQHLVDFGDPPIDWQLIESAAIDSKVQTRFHWV